jgi:hypothetical protein
VLANFGLLLALLGGRVVQQIFFGPLRPAEVEVRSLVGSMTLYALSDLAVGSGSMIDYGSLSLNPCWPLPSFETILIFPSP